MLWTVKLYWLVLHNTWIDTYVQYETVVSDVLWHSKNSYDNNEFQTMKPKIIQW